MAISSITGHSKCLCTSLRCFVVVIGLWGLLVGAYSFVSSMVHSLIIIHREHSDYLEAMYHIYGAITIMMYEYVLVLIFLFSIYILYAAFKECPERSAYIMAWLIFAGMSDILTLMDLIARLIRGRYFSAKFIFYEVILLCVQFGCIAVVYAFYRTLPKRACHGT